MNLEQILKEHNDKYEYQDLKGYEGLYKINQYGIWSCFHKKLMIFSLEEYLRINLTNHQKEKHKHSFHRLLALQYIPNPDNLPEVNHLDREKTNNKVSNLEWCDRQKNAEHSLSKNYIVENIITGERIEVFNLSDFCRNNRLSVGSLQETIHQKRRKQHKGYKII